jgi:uncharacterized protein YcbK (DUF882 family)
MDYYSWKKDGSFILPSGYFQSHEFTCHCLHPECVDQKISAHLVDLLNAVRKTLGSPIQITSGYRCHQHQLDLASKGFETAKGISQHELGNASDIVGDNMHSLSIIILSLNYFKAIGFSKRFIHIDLRSDKERRWYYKN